MKRLTGEEIEGHAYSGAHVVRNALIDTNAPLAVALSTTLETLGTLAAQLIDRMDAREATLCTRCKTHPKFIGTDYCSQACEIAGDTTRRIA